MVRSKFEVARQIIWKIRDAGFIFSEDPNYPGWIVQRKNDGPSIRLIVDNYACQFPCRQKPWLLQLRSQNSRVSTFSVKDPDNFKPASITARINRMLDTEERCLSTLRGKMALFQQDAELVNRLSAHSGRCAVECSRGVISIKVTVERENESEAIDILKAIGRVKRCDGKTEA